MTPTELRNELVEKFGSANLLTSLELEASSFSELPRFLESSHFSMRIMLNDQAAMAAASTLAAKLKSDLQQAGVELEYTIVTQWKISHFLPEVLQRCEDGGWIPSESFNLELQSGSVKRIVTIRASKAANCEIRRYLCKIPIPFQQDTIHQLLEAWVRKQLEWTGLGHWNPVLYPTRTIQVQDIERLTHEQEQQELQPQLR